MAQKTRDIWRWLRLGLALPLLIGFELPALAADATGTIGVAGVVLPQVTFTVASMSPDCRYVRSGEGNNSSKYCVYIQPVLLTIASNEPWRATISARDVTRLPGRPSVATSALRYGSIGVDRYSSAASSPALGPRPQEWLNNQPAGISSFPVYFYLRINNNEDPARFNAEVTFHITQKVNAFSYMTYTFTIPVKFTPVP